MNWRGVDNLEKEMSLCFSENIFLIKNGHGRSQPMLSELVLDTMKHLSVESVPSLIAVLFVDFSKLLHQVGKST